MTTITVQSVVAAAEQLSPTEQLEVIQALSRVLQQRYPQAADRASTTDDVSMVLPPHVRRTPPVTDLRTFAGDFWPEDETADDINNYVAQQRAVDRLRDVADLDNEHRSN